jgi:hypothetical protein
MSNTITIELCAEDRARLDKIYEALTARHNCEGCVKSALEYAADVKTAANTPAESAQEPTGAEKAETLTDTHPIPDGLQWTTSDVKDVPQEAVSFEQVKQKVQDLVMGFGGAKKAKTRAIVNEYATKVSDLVNMPDKCVEIMGKLEALEKEV